MQATRPKEWDFFVNDVNKAYLLLPICYFPNEYIFYRSPKSQFSHKLNIYIYTIVCFVLLVTSAGGLIETVVEAETIKALAERGQWFHARQEG